LPIYIWRESDLEVLGKANTKEYGREIAFKDLTICGIAKINFKVIEKL